MTKLKRDNGLTYARNQVLISCGGKRSLYNVFKALLDPGDEVIVPAPYWVSFPEQVKLSDAVPVFADTAERGRVSAAPRAGGAAGGALRARESWS